MTVIYLRPLDGELVDGESRTDLNDRFVSFRRRWCLNSSLTED